MKNRLIFAVAALGGTCCVTNGQVIISEVVSGSMAGAQPKFVELTNVSSNATVTLGADDALRLFSNAATTSTTVYDFGANAGANNVTLLPGQSWTIALSTGTASTSWNAAYGASNQPSLFQNSTPNGNGNDVYELQIAGVRSDVYGIVVPNPGATTGSADFTMPWAYSRGYARRQPNVCAPSATFAIGEWIIGGNNSLGTTATDANFQLHADNTSPNRHANICGCPAPGVTTQPASTSTCAGSTVSLTAVFSGTALTLQWRKDGTTIPGATSGTLMLAAPTLADAGTYDCVATPNCGSVTTAAVALTVVPNLTVASQPIDQAVNVDSPVTFLVQMEPQADCGTPLTYQWQRRNPTVQDPAAPNAWINLVDDEQMIHTQTSAMVLMRPIPALATGFRCRIGGGCGCRPAGGFLYTDTVNFSVACPADFNADGGIDFQDIEAFFMRWENGC